MSGTMTPTVRVRSVRSEDAAVFGRYFSRSLARRIFSLSAPDTGCAESGLSARDTVETLTPTTRAMSFRVVRAGRRLLTYLIAFSYGWTSSPVFSSVGHTTTCLVMSLNCAMSLPLTFWNWA